MVPRDIKFINGGRALEFDAGTDLAINPEDETAIFGGDFRNLLMTVVGTGTVIVYGSTQKDPPDFSAPSSILNSYAPIVLADYSLSNTYYDGAAGVVAAGDTKIVELNTNLLTWFAIHRSVDTVDVLITETDNA